MHKQIKTLEMWQEIFNWLAVEAPEVPEDLLDAMAWELAKHFAERSRPEIFERIG